MYRGAKPLRSPSSWATIIERLRAAGAQVASALGSGTSKERSVASASRVVGVTELLTSPEFRKGVADLDDVLSDVRGTRRGSDYRPQE